jgi:threonine dehydratase
VASRSRTTAIVVSGANIDIERLAGIIGSSD